MKTTINPSWSAATKRVEKQQSEYEARLLKIEELNKAYQTASANLKKLQEKILTPLENELSKVLEHAKNHEKKRDFYRQKINRLRKLQFQKTVHKKERQRLRHRQEKLNEARKVWRKKLTLNASTEQMTLGMSYQLGQLAQFLLRHLFLSPRGVWSPAQDQAGDRLQKRSMSKTMISLWVNVQLYLIDQALQKTKVDVAHIKSLKEPQSNVSDEVLTQALQQLQCLTQRR